MITLPGTPFSPQMVSNSHFDHTSPPVPHVSILPSNSDVTFSLLPPAPVKCVGILHICNTHLTLIAVSVAILLALQHLCTHRLPLCLMYICNKIYKFRYSVLILLLQLPLLVLGSNFPTLAHRPCSQLGPHRKYVFTDSSQFPPIDLLISGVILYILLSCPHHWCRHPSLWSICHSPWIQYQQ